MGPSCPSDWHMERMNPFTTASQNSPSHSPSAGTFSCVRVQTCTEDRGYQNPQVSLFSPCRAQATDTSHIAKPKLLPAAHPEVTFPFRHTARDLPSAPFSTARFPSFPDEKSNRAIHLRLKQKMMITRLCRNENCVPGYF